MKDRYRRLLLLLGSLLVLFLCILLNSVLSIGDRLAAVHPALAWVFYAAILALVVVGVVLPALEVFTAPVFSLRALSTSTGAARQRWCARLVRNVCENTDLPDTEKAAMLAALRDGDLADDAISAIFIKNLAPQMDLAIADTAKKVFLVTAVSQTAAIDMLGSLSANMNLVRSIVRICGFRPSTSQLVGLYCKVLSVALLAAGLEEINMEELIPMLAGSEVAKLPGLLLSSAAQGATNAFLTLRVGVATKYYLIDLDKELTRKKLRQKTFREALPLLKLIVSSTIRSVPELFRRKKVEA